MSLGVGSLPLAIVSGDFNHDGQTDLATANSRSDDVSILLGDGNGNFAVQSPLAAGDAPSAIAAGDFNADGADDLAVTNPGTNTVTVLFGASDGNFAAANLTELKLAVGETPLAVVAADFNGDHRADLAVANQDSSNVSVLLNLGGGQFSSSKQFSISAALGGGLFPAAIVADDFNGDGILDLATSNVGSRNVSILSGSGDGTFAAPDQQASAAFHSSPVLADLNGDGVADLVVMDRAGNVLLRLGRKDIKGTFQAPRIINPGVPASSFAVLKDGLKNVLAVVDRSATSTGQHLVTIYRIAKNGSPNAVRQIDLGDQYNQIVGAKLNGDKRDDLVAINSTTGTLAMFLRSGVGFDVTHAVRMAVAAAPSELVTASLDGAGGLDVLVADQSSGTVNIVFGGFANPQLPVNFRSGTGPTGVTATDEVGIPRSRSFTTAPLRWSLATLTRTTRQMSSQLIVAQIRSVCSWAKATAALPIRLEFLLAASRFLCARLTSMATNIWI